MVLHGQLCGRVGRRRELILERPSFGRAVRFPSIIGPGSHRLSRSPLLPFLLALSIALGAVTGATAQRGPRRDQRLREAVALQETFASVADKVFPSLVSLTSFRRVGESEPVATPEESFDDGWRVAVGVDERYPRMRRLASATGFAVSADGYILTTLGFLKKPGGGLADVIDAEAPDGSFSLCEVLGTEPTLDLAVLKLVLHPGVPPQIEPVVIADPNALQVGDWAIAVGDPLGAQQVFAAGLISACPDRACPRAELAATFLEASLQVHPEAYGGTLVDLDGAVMGMLVPHRSGPLGPAEIGLVYALPMSIATGVYESLKVARSVATPWLGVSLRSMPDYRDDLRARGIAWDRRQPVHGVYVDEVFHPSPAALAGLRSGDILVDLDGQAVSTVYLFQRSLYLAGIGNTIKIDVYRDGQMMSREVPIEARPAAANTSTTN